MGESKAVHNCFRNIVDGDGDAFDQVFLNTFRARDSRESCQSQGRRGSGSSSFGRPDPRGTAIHASNMFKRSGAVTRVGDLGEIVAQ